MNPFVTKEIDKATVDSRYSEPRWEMKNSSLNRKLKKMGVFAQILNPI